LLDGSIVSYAGDQTHVGGPSIPDTSQIFIKNDEMSESSDICESQVSSSVYSSELFDDTNITPAAVQAKLGDLVSQLNSLKKVKAEI
jgi:hypothetical protein